MPELYGPDAATGSTQRRGDWFRSKSATPESPFLALGGAVWSIARRRGRRPRGRRANRPVDRRADRDCHRPLKIHQWPGGSRPPSSAARGAGRRAGGHRHGGRGRPAAHGAPLHRPRARRGSCSTRVGGFHPQPRFSTTTVSGVSCWWPKGCGRNSPRVSRSSRSRRRGARSHRRRS